MKRAQLTGAVLLTMALTGGCTDPHDAESSAADPESLPIAHSWISPVGQEHPLAGRIWRSRDGEFIDPATLVADLRATRFLLLGEKHDNPDHHELRLAFLQELMREITVTHLGMEMLDHSQQQVLDALPVRQLLTDGELRERLRWDDQGWPWDRYGPLLRMALGNELNVVAANLSREQVMAAYGSGEIVTPPAGTAAGNLLETFSPDTHSAGEQDKSDILDDAMLALLAQEIDSSHCGLLPDSQFPPMIRIQQARDLSMAASLYAAPEQNADGMRLLVAGNYHVRNDLGVPRYLAWLHYQATGMEPAADGIRSLAFLEVSDELVHEDDAAAYLTRAYAAGVFDYVWFTAATEPQDYCASIISGSASGSR